MDTPVSARAALLQVLTYPGYGLDLIERIRRRTGGRVAMHQGSVYPALRQLEGEGLVRCRTEPTGVGRPRKYYELTVKGVRAAEQVRALLAAMLGPTAPAPAPASDAAIADRLRRCAEVSAASLALARAARRAVS
jgi:PadR family transcriptional regulator, regulatory protein PadR